MLHYRRLAAKPRSPVSTAQPADTGRPSGHVGEVELLPWEYLHDLNVNNTKPFSWVHKLVNYLSLKSAISNQDVSVSEISESLWLSTSPAPWLFQVNHAPSFATESELDHQVKHEALLALGSPWWLWLWFSDVFCFVLRESAIPLGQ